MVEKSSSPLRGVIHTCSHLFHRPQLLWRIYSNYNYTRNSKWWPAVTSPGHPFPSKLLKSLFSFWKELTLNVENLKYKGKEQTEPWSHSREGIDHEHSSGFLLMSCQVLRTILNSPLRTNPGLTQWSSFRKPLLTLTLVLPGATPVFSQATWLLWVCFVTCKIIGVSQRSQIPRFLCGFLPFTDTNHHHALWKEAQRLGQRRSWGQGKLQASTGYPTSNPAVGNCHPFPQNDRGVQDAQDRVSAAGRFIRRTWAQCHGSSKPFGTKGPEYEWPLVSHRLQGRHSTVPSPGVPEEHPRGVPGETLLEEQWPGTQVQKEGPASQGLNSDGSWCRPRGLGDPGQGQHGAGWERSKCLFWKGHSLFQADGKLWGSALLQTPSQHHSQQISACVWGGLLGSERGVYKSV